MIKIPIRITVLGLFLLLSVLIMTVLLYIQSSLSQELAQKSMNDYFQTITYKIENKINNVNTNIETLVNTQTSFLNIMNTDDFAKNKTLYLKTFSGILKDNEKLYSVYIGFSDDRFYEVIKLDINKELRKKYNAQLSDKWLEIEILKKGVKRISLYNAHFEITSTRKEFTQYRPTQRPWYYVSKKADEVMHTGIYNFSSIDARGLTYAKEINNGNIFAIDVLMDNYSDILKSKNSATSLASYIFKEDGTIIAKSAKEDKIYKQLYNDISVKKTDENSQSIVEINNKKYICNISRIENGNKLKEYLLSYVLLDEMATPYIEKFARIEQALILLIIILLPLIWYLTSVIAKPIVLLSKESKKVQNRKFEEITPVYSSISEVELLSKSIVNMASSISEYQLDLEQKVADRTKALELLSITDKLTGLYNRAKLDSNLEYEIQRASRYDTQFGMIIIDIDYFKKVNDIYGHQVGDTIIIEFANILKNNTRKTDTVGRWGGEEFVIISPESNLKDVLTLAEILRKKIFTNVFSVIKNKTASFGVSAYIKNDTVENLMSRADEALYKAKENGRNKVETLQIS